MFDFLLQRNLAYTKKGIWDSCFNFSLRMYPPNRKKDPYYPVKSRLYEVTLAQAWFQHNYKGTLKYHGCAQL